MVSRHRGQRPNNALNPLVRKHALQFVRTHYADFGPNLAQEKLTEERGLKLSRETLKMNGAHRVALGVGVSGRKDPGLLLGEFRLGQNAFFLKCR